MTEQFAMELRRTAFPLAYRMVGSVSEAEDLVQEGLLRLQTSMQQGTTIANPHGFLVTTTTRLALDHLKSARVKRELYPGEWLPEPVVQEQHHEPSDKMEMAETLSFAFLLLLETLSPVERAVFLLRQVFDYDYEEIAEVLGRTEASCRQAFSRARKHVAAGRPRFEASPRRRDALVQQFLSTCTNGSMEDLERLLAEDVQFHGDGGGIASAVQHPVSGNARVARLVHGIFKQATGRGLVVREALVNGQPGLLFAEPSQALISVFSLQVADGQITAIHAVINPEKLGHLGAVSDRARSQERQRD